VVGPWPLGSREKHGLAKILERVMENSGQTKSYQRAYRQDYGFESEMVAARQRLILELLKKRRPRRVLEIGSGPVLLYDRVCRERLPIKQWVVVEPCGDFVRRLRPKTIPLKVFPGFFERMAGAVKTFSPQGFDLIICSGMLNEIRCPQRFLRALRPVMASRAILHVNVPNRGSLHRQLGVAMGLIKSPAQASRRNQALMQYHVFDLPQLTKILICSGFAVQESGGYFLKPFSHVQMAKIKAVLTRTVLDGLWVLGRQYPQFATEIFINAKLRQ